MCMRTAVYFEGRRAGSLDWRQEPGGVRAVLDWKTEGAAEPAAPSEMD